MSRLKSFERRMEGRTGVVDMHSNDLCIGVKSLSNLAMAGSYRNMPSYSLISVHWRCKVRIRFAGAIAYGIFSNSETVNCVK